MHKDVGGRDKVPDLLCDRIFPSPSLENRRSHKPRCMHMRTLAMLFVYGMV